MYKTKYIIRPQDRLKLPEKKGGSDLRNSG